jgi:hypothetical protein
VSYLQVTYEDLSRQLHLTQQCFYWTLGQTSQAACGTYSRAE